MNLAVTPATRPTLIEERHGIFYVPPERDTGHRFYVSSERHYRIIIRSQFVEVEGKAGQFLSQAFSSARRLDERSGETERIGRGTGYYLPVVECTVRMRLSRRRRHQRLRHACNNILPQISHSIYATVN